jgi:spore germination protein
MPDLAKFMVNGYAYPSISPDTLGWWLPRLTWVSAFSYGFIESGELIPLEDQAIIEQADRGGVGTLMVLTPLDEQGMFNDYIATQVFQNQSSIDNLIDNIVKTIVTKGLAGIDFDFEYLSADYADDYVDLVRRTRERLAPLGLTTTVALAPKTRADQPGLLYQGHDYYGMGQAADYCLIMTYEWGYTYGEPMPVAPIGNVERVIQYAVSEIPPEKILMGLNNYGYDWALPFVEGVSAAEKLTNYEAEARAEYYGVPIQWDAEAMAPFFSYVAPDGTEHIVWFENEDSWRARLKLAEKYGLAGVGIWNIMHVFYGGL